jgi:hypothetical protein
LSVKGEAVFKPRIAARLRPVLVLAGLALALGVVASPGAAIAKSANAAVVIKGGSCSLLDASGVVVAGQKFHAVTNRNGSKATCRAKGFTNTTGKAIRFNFANTGVQCQTPGGLTNRWHQVITPSGRARVVCHFRNA